MYGVLCGVVCQSVLFKKCGLTLMGKGPDSPSFVS